MLRRLALTALAATTALFAWAPVAHAGTEGEVVLRLEIRGAPVTTDTFFMGGTRASNDRILPHGAVCGPPSDLYNDPALVDPCTARTYEMILPSPVGTVISFGFYRDPDWGGTSEGGETLFEASTTVRATRQVYTFVYDYSLGGLPDTAIALEGGSQPAGVPGLIGIGLVAAGIIGIGMVAAGLLATRLRTTAARG